MDDETIERILKAGDELTQRESEVLELFERGTADSAKEAADVLFVSKRTIDFHLANVYDDMRGVGLKVHSKGAALRVYRTYRSLVDQGYGKTRN